MKLTAANMRIVLAMMMAFARVSSLCVNENRNANEMELRCMSRWNGEGSNIVRLTIIRWDGSCHFPSGASVSLYGADQDCFTCQFLSDKQVMVNGKICATTVPVTMRSTSQGNVQIEISSTTTTTTITTTESADYHFQGVCSLVAIVVITHYLRNLNWQPQPRQQQQQHRRITRAIRDNHRQRIARPQRARRPVERLVINW